MGVCAIGRMVFVVRAHLYVSEQNSEAGTSLAQALCQIQLLGSLGYTAAHKSTQLHRVGLTSATHMVWYVPKWLAGVSVTAPEEILVSCVDKAVIVSLCPLTGNRLCVLPVFELGIIKPWHAVCLASDMLAVSTAGPCPRVWLIGRDCSVKKWYGTSGTGTGQSRSPHCLLPWAVCPGSENCVLACDCGNNSIVAIDFTHSQSHVMVSDVSGPCGVAVDIANRSLFVGE